VIVRGLRNVKRRVSIQDERLSERGQVDKESDEAIQRERVIPLRVVSPGNRVESMSDLSTVQRTRRGLESLGRGEGKGMRLAALLSHGRSEGKGQTTGDEGERTFCRVGSIQNSSRGRYREVRECGYARVGGSNRTRKKEEGE
jgi:hypothetical protein